MPDSTSFWLPAAVEAWDTWFRWREQGRLRDITIDDTWNRVASAVAGGDGKAERAFRQRLIDAFSTWRLLPDEHFLTDFGTTAGLRSRGRKDARALLNLGAFVRSGIDGRARFDRCGFESAAVLAVRFLERARSSAPVGGNGSHPEASLQVGLIGMADALRALELAYDSRAARAWAAEVAACLAEACLWASVELAVELGPALGGEQALSRHAYRRRLSPGLVSALRQHGTRHADLTSIDARPRLALLANGASDGVDPAFRGAGMGGADGEEVSAKAILMLRAAVQSWLDRPIAAPLPAGRWPGQAEADRCARLASRLRLPPPRWGG